ncbi:hypothetical protein C3L33_13407, partial [Rhododendron williamsianum]
MDSNRGPLLNAIEISKYVQIGSKTYEQDVNVLNALRTMSAESVQTSEGDPCVPAPWEWVTCSSNIPPRITKIMLSGKNMQGEIPSGLENMDALTELWLDGNSLTGSIPDMSHLINIKIVHLENNKLSGPLPSYFGRLPSLQELYVQNNSLSGKIPPALLAGNARSLIREGDVISIIDPTLTESVKIESVWRVAEVAIQCVEKHGYSRPRMQEIITAIQDAIKIEEGNEKLSPGVQEHYLLAEHYKLAFST